MKTRSRASRVAICACVCLLLSGSAQSAPPTTAPSRQPPPGEGVVCAWAIYTAMASVGSTCFPNQNPDYQAELRQIVSKLDAYVMRNAKEMTPAMMAEFKRTQGHTATPANQLCGGDAIQMYRAIEKANRAEIAAGVDRLVARDGKPSWGTCL